MTLPETIRTPRLLLRAPTLDDAEAVFIAFGSDPEVSRRMLWPLHATVSDSRDYLMARIKMREAGKSGHWLITDASGECVIGMISILLEGTRAEVGFLVNRASEGRGIATEALQAVLEVGLRTPGVARLWGWCTPDNPASARVMVKAGMSRDRFPRRYGKEYREALVFTGARRRLPLLPAVWRDVLFRR
jgi:RimJ/RimL family protein N-acetyltransferase